MNPLWKQYEKEIESEMGKKKKEFLERLENGGSGKKELMFLGWKLMACSLQGWKSNKKVIPHINIILIGEKKQQQIYGISTELIMDLKEWSMNESLKKMYLSTTQ